MVPGSWPLPAATLPFIIAKILRAAAHPPGRAAVPPPPSTRHCRTAAATSGRDSSGWAPMETTALPLPTPGMDAVMVAREGDPRRSPGVGAGPV